DGVPLGPGLVPIDLSGISLFSPDSAKILPSQRIPRRNFLEIFHDPSFPLGTQHDRIWVRQEGDTVHMNSWVVFFNGGFDPRPPYHLVSLSNNPQGPARN